MVVPLEQEGEPDLFLTLEAKDALPLRQYFRWKVVLEPAVGATEKPDRADAGLLLQLAPRRGFEILAGIDAALRELPSQVRPTALNSTTPTLGR